MLLLQQLKKLIRKILYGTAIYESLIRLRTGKRYEKEKFELKSPDVFEIIYDENYWGSQESHSGAGSTFSSTAVLRKTLPVIWTKYKIRTLLDVPCGDFNWMKETDMSNIKYIGGDIVEKMIEENNKKYQNDNIAFKYMDITNDVLPQVDMIFCKDCLQHLSFENVEKALKNFKRSGSKYLLVTSYSLTWKNWDIRDGDYRPLNLRKKPFSLPRPICTIKESFSDRNEQDKHMLLYELKSLHL